MTSDLTEVLPNIELPSTEGFAKEVLAPEVIACEES